MQISNILVHPLFQTHFVFQIFLSLFQSAISCKFKCTPLICPGFWNHCNFACFLRSNSSSDHYHKIFQNFTLRYSTVNPTSNIIWLPCRVINGGKSYIMLVTWHSYHVSSASVHCLTSQTNVRMDGEITFHFIHTICCNVHNPSWHFIYSPLNSFNLFSPQVLQGWIKPTQYHSINDQTINSNE